MVNFKNLPDRTTPVNAENLNKMQNDLKEELAKYGYAENYKSLANGFIYRKVGTDVEINVYYTNNDNPYLMPQYGNTTVGTLSEGYRPKNGILLPIFGRNIGNGTIYDTLIEVRTDGQVRLVNGHGPACQVSQIHGFVKYSVL